MKRKISFRASSALALIMTVSIFSHTAVSATTPVTKANPNSMHQVQRGKIVYDRFCSLCHGINLKGQKNWRTRKPNGKLPAPPHDETGHTWHHADDLLFGIIKYGLIPPYGPKNYKSDMPAWDSTLKDADIWATLAYIKSRWPKENQKMQAQINKESLE